MSAIYDLANEVQVYGGLSAEYIEKMMHLVPDVPVVKRETFILERAKRKNVLDVGCMGPMGEAINKASGTYIGIDKNLVPGIDSYYRIDLEEAVGMPHIPGLELIIAGEVIEHLSNAGHFLDMLRDLRCPVILTTPNAHSEAGYNYINRGIECVNGEHVAYYSWWTLKTLVERHGFTITEWYWYNGKPGTAEGLIFVIEGAV